MTLWTDVNMSPVSQAVVKQYALASLGPNLNWDLFFVEVTKLMGGGDKLSSTYAKASCSGEQQ